MVIQHNISAINSHRNLGINNAATAKNLEKLSSGYKINRAGDDAAGLAISEKMRGQIRGLAMAEQNTSNGISLIQTAEGGLNETHAILQRMRELAVQSSNGTYESEVDRVNIEKEFQALKDEIDRISDSTHYNNIKLLDGNLGKAGAPVGLSMDDIGTATVSNAAGVNFSRNDTIDMTIEMVNGEIQISGVSYKPDGSAAVPAPGTMEYSYENGVLTITGLSDGTNTFDLSLNIDPSKMENDSSATIKLTANSDGKFAVIDKADVVFSSASTNFYTDPANIPTISNFSADTAGGSNAGDGLDNNAVKIDIEFDGKEYIIKAFVDGSTGTPVELKVSADALPVDNKFSLAGLIGGGAAADAGEYSFDLELDLSKMQAGSSLSFDLAATAGTDAAPGAAVNIAYTDPVAATNTEGRTGLTFQIGANGDSFERVTLFVERMDTKNMGEMEAVKDASGKITHYTVVAGKSVDDISVATEGDAVEAIDIITKATNWVSSTRADLGALQNRLEHTLNNLGVTKENLTAAESTIRDVDMAKEMMEFTKNNILVQASQAMLAQANTLPQGVLQLLR